MKKSVSPRSLNKDDNKLSLQPTESTFSLNIDSEGLESGESGVVKHIKGNVPAEFSDESMSLPAGVNKVIGSVKDEQLNVVYFFVHNSNGTHSVVAFNSKTKTYRVVFASSALEFDKDSFVKADIVRLRRVPDDTEMVIETPPDPEDVFPVELEFRVEIDMSALGEKAGYRSYDSADDLNLFSTAQLRVQGVNTGFYEASDVAIGAGINTTSSSTKIIALNKLDHLVDGWVLVGNIKVFVHPDDLENSSAMMQYKINNMFFGDSDVFSNISYAQMNTAAGASQILLSRRCFGFESKDINELLVSDVYDGFEANIMGTTTQTGRLLDRKLRFVTNVDFSNNDTWLAAATAAINDYAGSGFNAEGRSHPTERFDNGDTGVGFDGDGDGDDDLLTITFCEGGAPGAAYDNFQDALAAFYNAISNGIPATLEDVCPAGEPTVTVAPGVFVQDEFEGVPQFFPSSTEPVVNPILYTFPDTYENNVEFYPSSCGTMRRKTRFVFALGTNSNGEDIHENLFSDTSFVMGANSEGIFNVGFSEALSEISLADMDMTNSWIGLTRTGSREFEISINVDGGNLATNTNALGGVAKVQAPQTAGSSSLVVADVCFNTPNICSFYAESGAPPPPGRLATEEVQSDESTFVPPVIIQGTLDADSEPEREADPESSTPESATSTAKTKKKNTK